MSTCKCMQKNDSEYKNNSENKNNLEHNNIIGGEGSIIQNFVKELKPYTLKLNHLHIFYGKLSFNKQSMGNCKCSLILHKNTITDMIDYILQFYIKNDTSFLKPIHNSGLLTKRMYYSNYDGFNLRYDTISQTLTFNTTDSNNILGSFVLEGAKSSREEIVYSDSANCSCDTGQGPGYRNDSGYCCACTSY